MFRFYELFTKHGFAQDVATYEDEWPLSGGKRAIVLPVRLPDGTQYVGFLDTGAPFSILQPELAEQCGDAIEKIEYIAPRDSIRDRHDQRDDLIQGMQIRGITYQGWLCRMTLGLISDRNWYWPWDITVFVPNEGNPYMPQVMLGMNSFLDAIRWAIDPEDRAFYFGSLGNDIL